MPAKKMNPPGNSTRRRRSRSNNNRRKSKSNNKTRSKSKNSKLNKNDRCVRATRSPPFTSRHAAPRDVGLVQRPANKTMLRELCAARSSQSKKNDVHVCISVCVCVLTSSSCPTGQGQ